jgi:protein SCO1/2
LFRKPSPWTIEDMGLSRTYCIALIIALLFTLSCRRRASGPEERYPIKGKVVSVDKRGSTVSIAHEDIPGLMDAMTMAFDLKDRRLLDQLAPGDRVQATLVVAGLRSRLEDVVVTRETVDPSSLGKAETWVEPKPGDEVPDFKLIDQNGKRLSFHQYRGLAVVLTFIYTRCPLPDYCPLMTDNFAQIAKALKSEPESNPRTQLLSITLDPEYDTPKVLREYAARHSEGPDQWDYATGTKDEVKQIATYFGIQYWREGDQVIHGLRTAIVGPDGKLVRLYRGNEWKPDEILTELRNAPVR